MEKGIPVAATVCEDRSGKGISFCISINLSNLYIKCKIESKSNNWSVCL